MKKFIKALNIVPSYLVFGLDVICVLVAAVLAVIMRDNFVVFTKTNFDYSDYLLLPIIIAVVQIIFFFVFKSYRIVVRYTNTKDVVRIFLTCFFAALSLEFINIVSFAINESFLVPHSILIMEFFIALVLMLFYRIAFKILYLESVNPTKAKRNIVIIGAGEAGITTKRALDRDAQSKYNVVAFFDSDKNKIGKNVENVKVLDYQKLTSFLAENSISFLIIAIQNFPAQKTNEVTEIALQYNVKVLIVPPVKKWINGELSFKQIKKVKIEDLLERGEIVLDKDLINKDLNGKTIMITGAAGSIGSEIVRQVMKFSYQKLILVANAETPVFSLRTECFATDCLNNIEIEIASVFDKVQIEE